MTSLASDSEEMPPLSPHEALSADALSAAEKVYSTIAEQKLVPPEDVSKMPVCHQAASLMVSSLISNGHSAQHEIHGGWTVVEHSYVSVDTGNDGEIVIDPTWQQFLPADKRGPDTPKVLFGSRSEVISQARSFGVDEITLLLWEKPAVKMVRAQQ